MANITYIFAQNTKYYMFFQNFLEFEESREPNNIRLTTIALKKNSHNIKNKGQFTNYLLRHRTKNRTTNFIPELHLITKINTSKFK